MSSIVYHNEMDIKKATNSTQQEFSYSQDSKWCTHEKCHCNMTHIRQTSYLHLLAYNNNEQKNDLGVKKLYIYSVCHNIIVVISECWLGMQQLFPLLINVLIIFSTNWLIDKSIKCQKIVKKKPIPKDLQFFCVVQPKVQTPKIFYIHWL